MTQVTRFFLFLGILSVFAQAQDFPNTFFEKVAGAYRLSVGPSPLHYFRFQNSGDLSQFSVLDMALGTSGAVFTHTPLPGTPRGFYRVQAVEGWAPEDTDLDGMDDLWELQNGLNPLNPADASFSSVTHPGMSNLDCYRFLFGLTRVVEYYSAETSVNNRPFAISAETSVYNFPSFTGASIEAISAEVSVYQFPNTTGASLEAVSAEVSVFNSGVVAVLSEAFSAELSVFNTAPFSETPTAISPEISLFNAYTPPAVTRAISHELSVLKTTP